MAWFGSNENQSALTKGIQSFLRSVGMDQYYETFVTKGFDLETDLQFLTSADLDELGVTVPEHRRVLLAAAPLHRVSEEFRVYQWLRDNGLDYYLVSFVRSELVDFNELRNLELPDEDLYDELEITLAGHRKRLERAVQKLRKRQRTTDDAEPAIMEGWWGKPPTLVEAKYDFLCVTATIGSTRLPARSQTVDFMVDSGSDVTTLREEILETLDLELLGSIQSRGVHASCTKNLYKARLQIGTELLEIEVMGESYDSLGSRVFRHFRHYITGSKHVWLKGDYYDPTMIARPLLPNLTGTDMTSETSDLDTDDDVIEESTNVCTAEVQNKPLDRQSKDVLGSKDVSMSSENQTLSDSRVEDIPLVSKDVSRLSENQSSSDIRSEDVPSSHEDSEHDSTASCTRVDFENSSRTSDSLIRDEEINMTSCSVEAENDDIMCSVQSKNHGMTSCSLQAENCDKTSCSSESVYKDITSHSKMEANKTCLEADESAQEVNHSILNTDKMSLLKCVQTLKTNSDRNSVLSSASSYKCDTKHSSDQHSKGTAVPLACRSASANSSKVVSSSPHSRVTDNTESLQTIPNTHSSLLDVGKGKTELETRTSSPVYVRHGSPELCSEDCEVLDEGDQSDIAQSSSSDSDTNNNEMSDVS